MFTIGIYKTRAAAEDVAKLWADVYKDENMVIEFDGSLYLVKVRLDNDQH